MASAFTLCADAFTYPDDNYIERIIYLGQLMQRKELETILSTKVCIENEYIKLFSLGSTSYNTVPLASWWIDGKMMGKHYVEIQNFYQSCGFVVDTKTIRTPHDHISLMFSFLALLIEDNRLIEAQDFCDRYLSWLLAFKKSLDKSDEITHFGVVVEIAIDLIGRLNGSVKN